LLPPAENVVGFATQSLHTLSRAKRRGSRAVLDRACPHVDFQQAIIAGESAKTGARYAAEPAWFRERQLAEYAVADRIVVPSRYSLETFPKEQQLKCVVAPLLPRELTRVAAAREQDGTFTLGVLGGNPLRKGYLYLLEAWHQLALPNARLLLRAADFTPYPRLAELARHPTIERVGFLPRISDFYSRCDVFALPSVDDGFGMALLEAMAHGLPVVTTTHTGASELLTDGVDGLVVPPFSAEALAEAVLKLYRSPQLRQAMGEAGRATVARVEQQQLFEKAYVSALA
jgi:glycosyltransferase involved in cell wall biosynthesis